MPDVEHFRRFCFIKNFFIKMERKIIDEIIRNRRSVFPEMYEDREIDDETILNIIENATWAPNHKLTEPWHFVVFKKNSLEKLSNFLGKHYKESTPEEKFSEMKYKKILSKPLKSACMVAVCYRKDPQNRVPEQEELLAMGAAIENFWLTCSAYGIGCYLSTTSAINHIGELADLQEGDRCVGLFYMGWRKPCELTGTRSDYRQKISWIS